MSIEEFNYSDKSVILELSEEIGNTYKIKSYEQKLRFMEKSKIPQKPIKEVVNHFFLENSLISKKLKKDILKIIYSPKNRILIIILKGGNSRQNDIIWNRDKLIKIYGWFFFVSLSDEPDKPKKNEKKKKKRKEKEEQSISSENFQVDEISFTLEEKINMRPLYKTKEFRYYENIIKSNNIEQMPIKKVLEDLFLKNEIIPLKEKKSVKKVIYYKKEKVIVVKSLIGDQMYENLKDLVKKYGWYFYITGVPVGKSDISIAIDNIERTFSEDFFKNVSIVGTNKDDKNISITLYPISSKPNHNCTLLSLGELNILLDCGIEEDDLEKLESYILEKDRLVFEQSEKIQKDQKVDNKETQNNELPNDKASRKIDAIFLSHSHYDHISALKNLIKIYPDTPVFCSRITLDLYMLRDSNFLKQENYDSIEEEEYRNVIKNVVYVENGSKVEFKTRDCFLSFFHAGHMPGALMMLVKVKDFRFLYTGDYTYHDITPFAGTKRFLEQISRPIDFLLIDGTSAHESFGDPTEQFHSLILFLEQKAEYGDNSLIGADPSSLAISFMLRFWRYFRKLQLKRNYKNRPNIYVDEMVRKNIQVINHRYEYIYGPISKLIRDKANPFNSIKFRWFDITDLEFVKKRNNIIISHPPDLSYGLIRNIISRVAPNPHNMIFLAGSIHEEPGSSLVEGAEEIEFSDTWKVPFRALLINKFAPQIKIKLHGDKEQALEMLKILEPRNVCFFHQSPFKLDEVAKEIKISFDFIEKVSILKEKKLLMLN